MLFRTAMQRLILIASLLAATSAWADGVQKLGFIDTARVYQESKQAQAIQATLDKEFSARQAKLQQTQKEGLTLKTALESGKIPPAERERKARQLLEMDRNFRTQSSLLAEDYNLRRNEEFASLQQNANQAIATLAHKEGYDLILQDVVFVNTKFDITDAVIKLLNAQ